MPDTFFKGALSRPALHRCEGYLPDFDHGERATFLQDVCITECEEQPDGRLIAGTGGVGSQVAFCPYCGFRSALPPVVQPIDD